MFPKDTEAPPAGVDDMTRLSYLHEPGVLQNLATRYELNEIYVSMTTPFGSAYVFGWKSGTNYELWQSREK